MSLDKFFGRKYHARNYNCSHLAIEVFEDLTGKKVVEDLAGFLIPGELSTRREYVNRVTMLPKPADPCFVLMSSSNREPHVGVFHRGRIIHFAGVGNGRNSVVQFQPPDVVTVGYTKIRYFTC